MIFSNESKDKSIMVCDSCLKNKKELDFIPEFPTARWKTNEFSDFVLVCNEFSTLSICNSCRSIPPYKIINKIKGHNRIYKLRKQIIISSLIDKGWAYKESSEGPIF